MKKKWGLLILVMSVCLFGNFTKEQLLAQLINTEYYAPNIVRLFVDPDGGPIRNPKADPYAKILVDGLTPQCFQGDKVEVSNENGLWTIQYNGDKIIKNMKIERISGKMSVSFEVNDDEYFYGGGCQNGRFSHRGEEIDIVNTNNWVDGGVASPAPFFWSTGGYGMMWHTFAPGKYDFGKTEQGLVKLTHDTPYLDLFIMVDKGVVALLRDYYKLTGNPVLLPKFGFYEGHLNAYNRDYWKEGDKGILFEDGKQYIESQKDNGGIRESLNGEKNNYQFSARAVIDRYLDNDFPLGWILPNDGYGAGYGQTNTLDGNIENLRSLGDYARNKGVEIGLWTQSDLHPKDGIEPLLQRDIVKEVRDAGVRVLKTDVAWVGAGYSFGLNGVADVANIMPQYGNHARPFIITLDGWAGTQRYAGIWTGDQTGGEWEYIRFHIPTYIGSGLSGQPNITSDVDGIFGGKNEAVNIRDFQWKTFTPMQLNMDGWGSNPKYPQALGVRAANINRWYLKLKSRLLPYTYSIAHEAINGKPIMRAMFLEDENPYTLSSATRYQFMYGPSLLVAPIYQDTRMDKETLDDERDNIYLSKGQWVDFFSGDIYEGGRIINDHKTPLQQMPLFVKRGAIIPMHSSSKNPSEIDPHTRVYAIYPYEETDFIEYDDDGVTDAYLTGNYVTNRIDSKLNGNKLRVIVEKTKLNGNTDFFHTHKSTLFVIQTDKSPKRVKINGKKLKKVTDYNTCINQPNTFFYGSNNGDYIQKDALVVNAERCDVTISDVILDVSGIEIDTTEHLLQHNGMLSAPVCDVPDSMRTAYTLTPSWESVNGADYYELEYDEQLYSTIHRTNFTIDELSPNTAYTFKIRAVNKDGKSAWTELTASTVEDPLRDAVHGIKATTSCENQPGQNIQNLFDFDVSSVWHTTWGKAAVPFDINIDMKSVNQLDHIQYMPRYDAGNGTLLEGTVETSMDKKHWERQGSFKWERNGKSKEMPLNGTARYMRIHVTRAVGNFGSGQQLYIFRQPQSEWSIPGDINQDKKLDDNDITSYLNYTGLRRGDNDFEGYVSKGDLNGNGLIDAYDISEVMYALNEQLGDRDESDTDTGKLSLKTDKSYYHSGDTITILISGQDLCNVDAISLCIPYDAEGMEYISDEPLQLSAMYDMTRDRLHTNGTKALYPTFINLVSSRAINGNQDLVKLYFIAKKDLKYSVRSTDEILVRRQMTHE